MVATRGPDPPRAEGGVPSPRREVMASWGANGGHQLTRLECCKIGRAWDPRRDWCLVRKIAEIF